MAAIITFNLKSIMNYSKALPFVIFSAAMLLQFVTVLVFFPETKGVSLEELQRKMEIS
jgi:hypothetical protein